MRTAPGVIVIVTINKSSFLSIANNICGKDGSGPYSKDVIVGGGSIPSRKSNLPADHSSIFITPTSVTNSPPGL